MSGYFLLSDGRTVSLKDGFVIGRAANCDLPLDDTKASRRHARCVIEGGVVEIEDLGSSNGTLLNGKPVTRRMLRAGDQVQIGTSVFTYHPGEPSASASASTAASAPAGGRGGASTSSPRSPVFDDDDELFGGEGPAAAPETTVRAPAAEPPRPAPVAAPTPAPAAAPRRTEPPPAAPAPKPEPAPAPASKPKSVVEFADEIVEVRKPAATAKSPAKPGSGASGPVVTERPKVLQFSKNAASSNVLGDDVGQMSSGMRGLVFVVVIAGMVGLAWLVMKLVR